MATSLIATKIPRPSARVAVLTFVGALSASTEAWAFPPQMLESDPSDGAAAAATPFPVPDALRPSVRFWRELFTRHASDRVVVHDRENMDVVWRVIELPKNDAGAVMEAEADKAVRAATQDLRERLKRLAVDPRAIDEEDRVLLTLAGRDPRRLHGAADRLRTQRGVADHFREGLARSSQWIEQLRQILIEEGVPTEIAVLPFVESMFNPAARSFAGAAGLWQLMPGTARGLKLKVTRNADERLDVMKATRAAAQVLRQNYRMLGSWPLAITAYNYGPFGLKKAVDAIGSTDLITLIDSYDQAAWGFAAKNFYAEFLAVREVVAEAMAGAATEPGSIRD